MKTIAIVKVDWVDSYDQDGYVCGSKAVFENCEWKEVSDKEYQEIRNFIKDTKNFNSHSQYVLIDKDVPSFDSDFAAWKLKKDESEKKRLAKEARAKSLAAEREANKMQKQIAKAKKILKEAGIKE